ncbi:MAG TPA: SCO family protein [Acidobacteriaceae bacterium]|nr:SCO family protein [Acidobacteriaceae bacterium]
MRSRARVAALVAVWSVVGALGCHEKPKASASEQYPIRGVVERTDAAGGHVVLKHEAVPGLMEAMTMSYPVMDPAALSEMHPGDRIAAVVLADKTAQGPTHLRLKDVVIIAQAKPDYLPAVQYHVPAPGDLVPNFKLLNQAGKTVDLKGFRGKVVLLTFIYTRCALPDYCPRMSKNFAEIEAQLAKDEAVYRETHLLSVSFDPEFDTPKVLKTYGAAYTGHYGREDFAHWDFAAPPKDELPRVEQFFAVGVTPGDAGSLQHSMSTVIIGKDGKVVAFYPSNDWSVAAVLDAVKQAAKA